MSMTLEQMQKFMLNSEAVEKSITMDANTFKNSLAELGLAGVSEEEASALKGLIDLTVKKDGKLDEKELEQFDQVAGGKMSTKQALFLAGGLTMAIGAGVGIGIAGKKLYDDYQEAHADPKTGLGNSLSNYNKHNPTNPAAVVDKNGPMSFGTPISNPKGKK